MKYRYYLTEVPEEFRNRDRVQVFTQNGTELNYLMDYSDMERICLQRGWPVPTSGPWVEFPESLEYASLEADVAALTV